MKKLFILLSIVFVLMIPSHSNAATYKFEASEKYIALDQTVSFQIPYTDKKVTWRTSNNKVKITKKYGYYAKINGKKKGTSYVYATVNGKTYKKKVTVFSPSLNYKHLQLELGGESYLSLYGKNDKYFQGYSFINAKFTSSNKNIITVDKYGYCHAVGLGSCTVTVKYNGKKYKCTFTVTEPFSSKDALKNTIREDIPLKDGYIVKLTNNYYKNVCYRISFKFYKNGKKLRDSTEYAYVKTSNTSHVLLDCYDDNYNYCSFDDVKISISTDNAEGYNIVDNNIAIEKISGDNEVMALFTNPVQKKLYSDIVFVFYKDGNPIYARNTCDEVGKGNKYIAKVDIPHKNQECDYIDYDCFEVFFKELIYE